MDNEVYYGQMFAVRYARVPIVYFGEKWKISSTDYYSIRVSVPLLVIYLSRWFRRTIYVALV